MVIALERIELSDGGIHILIRGKVDDKSMYFIVDTGASHSVIDMNWARENLDNNDFILAEIPAHGIGASVEVHRVTLHKMEIGDLVLQERKVALIDFTSINNVYKQEGIEEVQGIIGGDILRDHGAIIDYDKGELHFSRN
jgi:hypothetical protein